MSTQFCQANKLCFPSPFRGWLADSCGGGSCQMSRVGSLLRWGQQKAAAPEAASALEVTLAHPHLWTGAAAPRTNKCTLRCVRSRIQILQRSLGGRHSIQLAGCTIWPSTLTLCGTSVGWRRHSASPVRLSTVACVTAAALTEDLLAIQVCLCLGRPFHCHLGH